MAVRVVDWLKAIEIKVADSELTAAALGLR